MKAMYIYIYKFQCVYIYICMYRLLIEAILGLYADSTGVL